MVGAGQFLFGLGLGAEGPVEMSYRQSVTPDGLQGRMNSTMRSLNRAAVVVGAPLGGVLADTLGFRPALWIGITGSHLPQSHSVYRSSGTPGATTTRRCADHEAGRWRSGSICAWARHPRRSIA